MKKLTIIFGILFSFIAFNQAVSDDISSNISKCNKRNGKACYQVADAYFEGIDVEKDHQLAINYFEKSCSLNNDAGCDFLGNIYNFGNYVEKDYFKSFKYHLKACNLNNASACNMVGSYYESGEGIRQDREKAGKYYLKAYRLKEKSSNNNVLEAKVITNMSGINLNHLGISYEAYGDLYRAKKYYGLACDCHNQLGCNNYARLNRR